MKLWYKASEEVRGIPVTRFVASWYIAGGRQSKPQVEAWLRTLVINGEHLNDKEVELIAECTVNGKFELQESAKNFLR